MIHLFFIDALTFLFQEVGSIIGKKGEIVKRFRDEVSHYTIDFSKTRSIFKIQLVIKIVRYHRLIH